ncbi:hypothetical protein E4T81_13880 [Barnesiella sp. WM24]|uniref:hypothetical protein n=1 Tax=Barnesiella sp. WM24 TaxID=2558278 RepID=UPI0010727FA1|nr:hypothetical protein [Barnesiella sp. WM24]TFU91868.1 hypothetical protein E4T81_13880 [Barnesiella sp. WM24]
MEKVFFKPWVGKNYDHGGIFKKKILVVGESHYCTCKICKSICGSFELSPCEDINPDAEVNKYLSGQSNTTYKKFERSLKLVQTREESQAIWDSIVFYNYIQEALSNPKSVPTTRQWKNAVEPFFEIINKYNPNLIVCWGQRLYNKMPFDRWIRNDDIPINNRKVRNGYYVLSKNYKALSVCINHPASWGYDCCEWRNIINYFIEHI